MIAIYTICSDIPLSNKDAKCFGGIAFDGCQYYLAAKFAKEIVVLNRNFEPIECVKTSRLYTAICYDTQERCFWATAKQCRSMIFKLDCYFCEFDRLIVDYPGEITGISYCCKENKLLVSTMDMLLLVDKSEHCEKVLQKRCSAGCITSVLCADPFFFYITTQNSQFTLNLISANGRPVDKECIPSGYLPKAMLLCPCKDDRGCYHIYLLACKRGCYPYILDLRLDECLSESLCCCNAEKCCDKVCDCDAHCEPDDCCCDDDCCCESSFADIIESIALQEAAIAHIINAEGEKLQKAIADDANICELLKINESIKETIVHATHMEHVLFAKLELLAKCCGI